MVWPKQIKLSASWDARDWRELKDRTAKIETDPVLGLVGGS